MALESGPGKNEVADGIASILLERALQVDVYSRSPDEMFHTSIDQRTREQFERKTRLYCLASVLIAIVNEEQHCSEFTPLRKRIESVVFGGNSFARDEVVAAISDLKALLYYPQGYEVAARKFPIIWARKWLGDAGINSVNFVAANLFCHCWMQYVIAIARFLQEIDWH